MLKDRINYGYLLAYFLFFLIFPPIIALPVVIFMVWMKKTPKYSDYLLLMVCIAAYLGAINATKTPSGDQVNYFVAYIVKIVSNFFIQTFSPEPYNLRKIFVII